MAVDSSIDKFNSKPITNTKVYTVKYGDTLNTIAQRSGKSVQEIAKINNIKDINFIMEGQELILDYDSSISQTSNVQPVNNVSYKIKPGDTLNDIAKRYNTSVDAISKANGIVNVNLIYAGQDLVIPSGEASIPNQISRQVEAPVQPIQPVQPVQTSPIRINLAASYTGILRSKNMASPTSKATNGVITYDNKSYSVGAITNVGAGVLSQNDYVYLVGQVAGEGGLDCDDMLGVCSTILNRVEAGGMYGNSVQQALQIGYWPWGKTCNKYINYDANGNPSGFKSVAELGTAEYAKLQNAQRVVNDAMRGVRNVNKDTKYYGGDGYHNYFSDRV